MDVLDTLRRALADRYAIERELGQGGMATVYLATDLRHERRVALKVLRPELAAALGAERFLREIKTTAQLTHPHILPLLDSGAADGTLFYVMPYVEGESLRDRLTREKQLPLEDALRIAREVADALGYAHSHGVVHRDIKPENILLESGHAVVADFGIAKAVAAAGSERLTETGLAVGTPAYMSPEQAAGSADLDGRSDLYSLGCVLYEMLGGEPPYIGLTPQLVIAKKLSEPLPRISVVRETVPPAVEAALAKALARAPADRYCTAADFAAVLAHAEALRPGETPGRGRSRAPRWPLARWLVAAGVLVVVVVLGVLFATGVLVPSGKAMSSLAVLPLRNLSGDSTQEYFADGMTEALTTELASISGLKVISRTSTLGYKGREMPLRVIARELGVDGIVEGSVVREGGQVRVTARLIDGRTDRSIWDSTFDRQMAGILALYADVARTVAGAIGATLTPEEARRLRVVRTVDPRAYDEYLLGRQQAVLWTIEGTRRGIAHYLRAIAVDSTYSDPWASLVDAYWWATAIGSLSPKQAAPLAKEAAERAVALDDHSARAHAALALVRSSFEWRLQEADAEFRRALELNPGLSDVHEWYSSFLTWRGRHDDAVREALRAVALSPGQAKPVAELGWTYFYAGRYRESIAAEESALAIDSSFAWPHMELAWNYTALGRHGEAIEAVGRALRAERENQLFLTTAVLVHARAGNLGIGRRYLDSLLALSGKGIRVDPYGLGWAYAWLGNADLAVAQFSRAVDEVSFGVWGLKTEFLPAQFKADPRFRALLRRVGNE